MRRRAFTSALLLCLVGCGGAREPVVEEAEFGVFFGGQVQELKEIKKELDPARQKHGFRLTFRAPLVTDLKVSWELSLPATDAGPRAALVGATTARAGERRLDVPLAFRPQDPLGLWHAKVDAAGRTVIDRDFVVVAASPAPKSAPKPALAR